MKILKGNRIARNAKRRAGASASIINETRDKSLLTKRTDNGRWCLPSGAIDPGESVSEACVREVDEETGLKVEVVRLIGVYSDPNLAVQYADGNLYQILAFSFEAKVIGGTLGLSNETTDAGYYSLAEIAKMDIIEIHQERIRDAFANKSQVIVK